MRSDSLETTDGTSAGAARAVPRWMPPALVASAALAIVPMSWARWPDVLVDFGQQLYVPWRLSEGDVLYRDVAYLHGPLSQYANALLFRVFGTGFWTLALFNLATTALLTALLYRLFARLGGALSATTASLVFLSVFAFGQPIPNGNYNYVSPYVHEITHGALLAVACLAALARLDETGRRAWAAAAGLLLGLTFLTKAEVFVAAAVACVVYAVTLGRGSAGGRHPAIVGWIVAGAVVPPLLAFALFGTALPLTDALEAALGPFRPEILASPARANRFFVVTSGFADPAASLRDAGAVAAFLALFLVPAWLLARRVPPRLETPVAFLAAGLSAAALALLAPRLPWLAFARPLPLVALAVGWVAARRIARPAPEESLRVERLRLALAAFALALLPKILLRCGAHHYGFVLAMPVTLLAADAAVSLVPRALAARGRAAAVFRAPALVLLAAVAAAFLVRSRDHFAKKTVTVGVGRDAFLADRRGELVNAALAAVAREWRPGETFAALPEGAMLGYLLRVPNPTPYTNLMPPEVLTFGEDVIARAYETHPPALVALVAKSTAEYGLPVFGAGYARRLGAFVGTRYEPVAVIGAEPFRDGRFGISLLRAKTARRSPAP